VEALKQRFYRLPVQHWAGGQEDDRDRSSERAARAGRREERRKALSSS
jgi:hypothetical protein